jgi:hypothetical protein
VEDRSESTASDSGLPLEVLARENGGVQRPSMDGNIALLALSRALGCSDARVRILRTAFRDGSCTAAVLMSELGVSRSALTSQIRPLVSVGLLIPEADPHNNNVVGGSNRRRWRIDANAFDAAVDDFRRTVTGRH